MKKIPESMSICEFENLEVGENLLLIQLQTKLGFSGLPFLYPVMCTQISRKKML